MGKRHFRKSGNNKRLLVSNMLTGMWVLLAIVVSIVLISACGSGDGDSPQTGIVVWNSNEDLGNTGTDDDIFFSRSTDGGATLSTLQVLNSNAASDGTSADYFPQTMTDGNGTWVVAWFSNEGLGGAGGDDDIFFSRSTNDGVSWSVSQALNSNATTDLGEDLFGHEE